MSLVVVDVGTSRVRAARVGAEGNLLEVAETTLLPDRPSPGVVELDAGALARAVLEVAHAVLQSGGPVDAVGIAAQRATTVVWERSTGEPVGPAIGWQDLRTTGQCLLLGRQGIRLAPNQSATKLAYLLDRHDPERRRDLCFGTIECFVAWTLSGRRLHVTDATNAAVTGLVLEDASGWDAATLEALRIPPSCLPTIVDTLGVAGVAAALPGEPPIASLVGDQQASLVGQGCLDPATAKATFGTGGMLDCSTGTVRPSFAVRGDAGTFPIVTWQEAGERHWGVEAVMLSAGSCLEWCQRIGLVSSPAESDRLAASVRDAGPASFVPALDGLGTPQWDFGARGAFVGLDGSVGRAELVRAVLEGIANAGADLLDAVEADTGNPVSELRVDGGMSANATFLQLLADATGRGVAPSPVSEATTLGAAFLAGTAVGTWSSLKEAAGTNAVRTVVEPKRRGDRARWRDARARAEKTVPVLSALRF